MSAVRFDAAAPYEVDEHDEPFARAGDITLQARVYRPRGEPAEPLIALVDVHGGAWNRGDRTTGALHGRALAGSGMIVVSLDFRQGPDHRHPAASADVAAGVRWVRAHARRLGADPARVGLVGSSSGGQLALLHAIRPGAAEGGRTPILGPDGAIDAVAGDETVAFAVAFYPVADPLVRYRYVLRRLDQPAASPGFDAGRLIAAHEAYFADEAAMAEASVTRVLTAKEATHLPPVWVAQAELDDNVPAEITETFVRAYRDAGGRIEHVHVPGARHTFLQQPGPSTEKSLALAREFIARHAAGSAQRP